APYWIWTFRSSTTYAQWFQIAAASTLAAGEGFTMKGTSGSDTFTPFAGSGANNPGSKQRYDFRGKPNDGTIQVGVTNGTFTLVGNPYPSAIDIHSFLLDNAALINGTAYYWEQAVVNSHLIASYQGGYGKYTIGGGYVPADIWSYNGDGSYNADTTVNGAVYQRRFPPIGQGFMVLGTAAGNVSMKNTFRNYIKEGTANLSDFAKTSGNAASASNSVYDSNSEFFPAIPNLAGIDYTQVRKGYAPQIRINAKINDTGIIHTALGFGTNYTDGFDYSGDARATSDGTPAGFYFILENQPHEYAMSLAKFDIDKKYPIGLRGSAQTNFKIKVGELLYGFDANQQVYIHDKQTDVYHNIKTGEFDMTLPAGDIKDRFEVTFKEAALNIDTAIADYFSVYQNNDANVLTIKNPTALSLQSCALYDISGKTIFSKANLGSNLSYEYSTSGLSEGVYIVKLTTETNQVVAKKVSIFNKK
ncbi:MAG: putative adhesin, partial [Bacteroidota bacterium]